MLDDLPAPRLAFEGLRHHLAELVQPRAAAFAADARRGFDDAFDRQIIRQLASGRPRISCAASAWRLPALRSRPWPPASAWVSSRSSMASSSCSTSSLPRSDDCPNCSRRALASISFSRSISRRPTVTSLFASVSISRCARIIACALPVARKGVRQAVEQDVRAGVVTTDKSTIFASKKSPPNFLRESKSHSLTGSLWDARLPAASASQFRTRDRIVAQRRSSQRRPPAMATESGRAPTAS